MPEIATEWQRFQQFSAAALYDMLRFRQSIFVVEQRCPYPDLDGLDQGAWHLLLRADRALAGYLRLVPAPLRIGRVAVAAELRRRRLGRKLMDEALLFCEEHYRGVLPVLSAQVNLVPFYRGFGFEPAGEPFDDFGITHMDMELRR
jgi:ElaA protein